MLFVCGRMKAVSPFRPPRLHEYSFMLLLTSSVLMPHVWSMHGWHISHCLPPSRAAVRTNRCRQGCSSSFLPSESVYSFQDYNVNRLNTTPEKLLIQFPCSARVVRKSTVLWPLFHAKYFSQQVTFPAQSIPQQRRGPLHDRTQKESTPPRPRSISFQLQTYWCFFP